MYRVYMKRHVEPIHEKKKKKQTDGDTHMFVQNHNLPVTDSEAGNVISQQSYQNAIISSWGNILKLDALHNNDKHTAAINSLK